MKRILVTIVSLEHLSGSSFCFVLPNLKSKIVSSKFNRRRLVSTLQENENDHFKEEELISESHKIASEEDSEWYDKFVKNINLYSEEEENDGLNVDNVELNKNNSGIDSNNINEIEKEAAKENWKELQRYIDGEKDELKKVKFSSGRIPKSDRISFEDESDIRVEDSRDDIFRSTKRKKSSPYAASASASEYKRKPKRNRRYDEDYFARSKSRKRSKKKSSFSDHKFWPNLSFLEESLRDEAIMRLSILGPKFKSLMKQETKWRRNLYKQWLTLLENGIDLDDWLDYDEDQYYDDQFFRSGQNQKEPTFQKRQQRTRRQQKEFQYSDDYSRKRRKQTKVNRYYDDDDDV